MYYDYDSKSVNQYYEDRRKHLTQAYADGQADSQALRMLLAKSATHVGDTLIRLGRAMASNANSDEAQQLQPLRVRTNSGR